MSRHLFLIWIRNNYLKNKGCFSFLQKSPLLDFSSISAIFIQLTLEFQIEELDNYIFWQKSTWDILIPNTPFIKYSNKTLCPRNLTVYVNGWKEMTWTFYKSGRWSEDILGGFFSKIRITVPTRAFVPKRDKKY